MGKGKFKFHFKSGYTIVDRNKFTKLSQAQAWVRAHNKGTKIKGDKIVKTTIVDRKPIRRKSRGIFGTTIVVRKPIRRKSRGIFG